MKKTVLYIYGYGSNHKDSSTMKVMKSVMKDLGYNLISIQYDQKNPHEGIKTLENYIEEKYGNILSEKEKAISEKDKTISEKDQEIARLKQLLKESGK